jgi:hypothetical protein
MAVRIGLVLSAVVVFLGVTYAISGTSQTPAGSTLDLLFPLVAAVYGALALAAIWIVVLVVVVVARLIRARRRS